MHWQALLVSVVTVALLSCDRAVCQSGRNRQLLQNAPAPAGPSPSSNQSAPADGGNLTSNGTAPTPSPSLLPLLPPSLPPSPTPQEPSPSPPPPSTPPPPESAKDKIRNKWEDMESGKSKAEKAVAITIGVLMLVCILTCLVCCVFRRGGQWRVPGLQWFKKKFGQKDTRYTRYSSNNEDDGF